ncbi:hypothetical protein A6M21_00560 [Desulfotomaculum copahuensis]|uniref:Uncharacterized protein n=2 Tax=Desulfotomaculum copahuensis TaxID=1838280 RepID=A0A1B7LDZ2_9FIRM|nr:hypothetical protein A6M21_00560 [Desulfotomaculum copahuensis]
MGPPQGVILITLSDNLKNIAERIANFIPGERLEVGEVASLWYIARNKLIGLATLEIYLSQAEDVSLRTLIDTGIKKIVIPHIEKIQQLLHREGIEEPNVHRRSNLSLIGRDTGTAKFIQDDEIAISIRETIRLSLLQEYFGMVNSTRSDIMDLCTLIYMEDYGAYRSLIELAKKRGWLILSPAMP